MKADHNLAAAAGRACSLMEDLPQEALLQVAAYFQALSEPTRLQILNLLRTQERKVGELADLCGFSAANVSRHLSVLQQHGLVARESRGTSAFYRIADPAVYQLCDLVCGSIGRQLQQQAQQRAAFLAPAPMPAPKPTSARKKSGGKPSS